VVKTGAQMLLIFFTERRYASAVYGCHHVSVCPFVTIRHCTNRL